MQRSSNGLKDLLNESEAYFLYELLSNFTDIFTMLAMECVNYISNQFYDSGTCIKIPMQRMAEARATMVAA